MSIDTPRSAATSGSRPMMTNSLVPMPKAAAASAMRCKGMERGGKGRSRDRTPGGTGKPMNSRTGRGGVARNALSASWK